MPDNPLAISPNDQPAVNQLTTECRVHSRLITGRNWQTQAHEVSSRVSQLFALTGDANLSGYLS